MDIIDIVSANAELLFYKFVRGGVNYVRKINSMNIYVQRNMDVEIQSADNS